MTVPAGPRSSPRRRSAVTDAAASPRDRSSLRPAATASGDKVDLQAATRGSRAAGGARGGPNRRPPAGHPPPGRRRLRRTAGPGAVRHDHLRQRGGLRRAGPGPGHPVHLAVPAPPAALHRPGPRRLPARGADRGAVQAGPRGGDLRPRTPGAGAPHRAGDRPAGGSAPAPRGGRGAGGRALLHVAARRPRHRRPHHHLGPAGTSPRGRTHRQEFLSLTTAHQPPR
jgi:hypothetical protein